MHLVIVKGPAGVGKRAFAQTLQASVVHEAMGGIFLSGSFKMYRARNSNSNGNSSGSGEPLKETMHARSFSAFRQAFQRRVDIFEQTTQRYSRDSRPLRLSNPHYDDIVVKLLESTMQHLSPSVSAATAREKKQESPSMSKARELLDVLARFIPTIAGIQPLALILDNIECADSVSLELLEMLMREDGLKYAANTGLFIIATCQTDDDTYPESIERFLDRIANRHGPENKPTETIGHMTTHLVARNDRVTCVEMFHSSLEEIKSWTIANSAT